MDPGLTAVVLSRLEGQVWLMCCLMYGAGHRLTECVRLRGQNIDFGSNQIVIRDGKSVRIPIDSIPSK
jgi:hypothetical protein